MEIAVTTIPRPLLISRQPVPRDIIPEGIYYNVVFWARLQGEPRLLREMHGLVLLDQSLLRAIASRVLTLDDLRRAGAEVILTRELAGRATVGLGRAPRLLITLIDRGLLL